MSRHGIWEGLAVLVLGLVILLAGIRLLLPSLLLAEANHELRHLHGYTGRIEKVELHFLKGTYVVTGLRIVKTGLPDSPPFITLQRLHLAINWVSLLKGRLLANLVLEEPVVNIVEGKTKIKTQVGTGQAWVRTVRRLLPTRIDRLLVRNAEIHIRSERTKVPADFVLKNVQVLLENVTNANTPATANVTGTTTGNGRFHIRIVFRPLQIEPSFTLEAVLQDLNLTALNPLIRAYGNFDVKKGYFDLATQVTVSRGRMQGYAKPFFRDLDLFNWKTDVEKEKKNVGQLFWQGAVSLLGQIFKNGQKNQVATVVPIHGMIENPHSDLLVIIGGVLRNAFVQALTFGLQAQPAPPSK